MEPLFNSAVRVERLQIVSVTNGVPLLDWVQATDEDPALDAMLQFLKCRLDTDFIRPGKDILPAPEAGKAQDRVALMLTFPYAPIRAGDRIVAILNEQNKIPVPGTWEIRNIPDRPQDYFDAHHIEVQVIEVAQNLVPENWPAEEPFPEEGEEPFPEEEEEP